MRFTRKKIFIVSFAVVLLAAVILNFITHSPLSETMSEHMLVTLMKIGQSLDVGALLITFCLAVYDIFKERHNLGYSLLGAANIYILIGIIFGFIYSLTSLYFLNSVDIHKEFTDSFVMSYYALAGMDNPFPDVNRVIKNISVFETIFANLYTVMIEGRLLTK